MVLAGFELGQPLATLLLELRFVTSENLSSYFGALERYMGQHVLPVAFYSDKHSAVRLVRRSDHMTQLGRALT